MGRERGRLHVAIRFVRTSDQSQVFTLDLEEYPVGTGADPQRDGAVPVEDGVAIKSGPTSPRCGAQGVNLAAAPSCDQPFSILVSRTLRDGDGSHHFSTLR